MKLTDKAVMAAKPREKAYRIFDGEGLYLDIRPNGSKYWRMKCIANRQEIRLAFGVYPKVSLSEARQKRRKAQDALAAGKDPRHVAVPQSDMTFRTVAKAWFDARKGGWTERYAATVWHRLESDVFKRLGGTNINRIDAQDILGVIRPIDSRGAPEKAKRVLRYINAIFAYAIITIGDMRYNPGLGLHVAIRTRPVQHNPYLEEAELPEFLKRLDGYQGTPIVRLATKFLLLTMTRTGELRFARPEEIDWKGKVWKIPAERMKMGRPHWVPLSRQALAILEEAKEFGGDFIFPSPIRGGRQLSENAILYALYDMGYRGKLTGHGFRATASTILNERGYNTLAIERQLAHADRNTVRASYNHAEFLNERREILQAWADLLDDLRNSA
jgi:integrase